MSASGPNVLMLSPVSPFAQDSGYKIAVWSDLCALLDAGATITLLALCLPTDKPPRELQRLTTELIAVKSGGRLIRSFRSLLSRVPAATERYYVPDMERAIREQAKGSDFEFVVVQDVALGQWLPLLRDLCPRAAIAVRSHNFMAEITRDQLRNASLAAKPAFLFEQKKWEALERFSVNFADRVWTITDVENREMGDYYGISSNDCLPVSVDCERYAKVPVEAGDPSVFAHLGTLDMKKSPGMQRFLEEIWPLIKRNVSAASLVLGGKISFQAGRFGSGVDYQGYVSDDAEFYAQARFALNTQTIGAGVKLKSLTALAAGRTLLSTANGVKGMDVGHGEQYWDIDRLMQDGTIGMLWEEPALCREIARRGRDWVQAHHSRPAVARIAGTLLGS